MIVIVDYGLGNVRAFANIYQSLNVPFVVASSATDLAVASRIVLPGVGAFDQAMRRLGDRGMIEPLTELVRGRRLPTIGVCVGMQILAQTSSEGVRPGFGWVAGEVVRFSQAEIGSHLQIPHMGWNTVCLGDDSAGLFRGLDANAKFYFLHSYYFRCQNDSDVLATSNYGFDFSCAVQHDNIFGVQFHPEKSHRNGITLLKNFAEI